MNKSREKLSKQRQKLGVVLGIWAQRIKDMEHAIILGDPEGADKLAFCRQEHEKTQKAMKALGRGVSSQRAWASGGRKY